MIDQPPVNFIAVPAVVVFSKESPAIKDTFIRILGLAYDTKRDQKSTPNLVVDDLINFLCLARRTYFLHVEKLCELDWLRSDTPRVGFVRFSFPIMQIAAGKFSAKRCTNVQKVALKEEEEEDLNLIKDSSSSSSLIEESAKSCTKSDPRFSLLRAAGVQPNHIDDILRDQTIALEDILAMLAFCYDPKNNIRVPRTITGTNLSAGYRADATYYGSVGRIPPAILEHSGLSNLIPKQQPAVVVEPETQTDDTSGGNKFVVDPSVDIRMDGTRYTPAQAWEAALGYLQIEISKSTFETWISPTQVIRYDQANDRLIVGAPNTLSRDWLDGRLSSTARRILVGLLNRNVEIQFEVNP